MHNAAVARNTHHVTPFVFPGTRPRKRPSWPITVYRYWVGLEHHTWLDLPTSVKDEAEAMRALEPIDRRFCSASMAYQKARQESPEVRPDTENILRPSQLKFFNNSGNPFAHEAQRLTVTCSAAWANSRFILTQFQAAVGRYFRHQGSPPRPKTNTFRKAHFCHQFTACGSPVERIFGQGRRLHLEPVPPEAFHATCPQRQRKRLARTSGLFQVGPTLLPFKTILHRPLPAGSSQDSCSRGRTDCELGGYHNAHNDGHRIHPRWQWSLHLTVIAPHPLSRHLSRRKRWRHSVSKARYGRMSTWPAGC